MLVIAHHQLPAHPRVRAQLDAIAEAGLAADVVCLRGEGEAPVDSYRTSRLHRLPVRRHRGSGLLVYLAEYAAFFLSAVVKGTGLYLRQRHRVVVTHSLPDPLIFSMVVPRLLGAHMVLNLHEFTPELFRTRYGLSDRSFWIRVSRILERASSAIAHRVITVHDAGAQLLTGRGVARSKLVVVMNAVEMLEPPAATATVATPSPFTLLYHGTIGNEYDLASIIDALAVLRNRGIEPETVRLRIVGDGPELPRLRALARHHGLDERWVTFEGRIAYDRVGDLLEDAHLGVAVMRETPYAHLGLPTKLLECVAAGLPVLSTPGAAIRGYFGEDSLVFVPFGDSVAAADAIEALRRDPARRQRIAQRAWHDLYPVRREVMNQRYAELFRVGGRLAEGGADVARKA